MALRIALDHDGTFTEDEGLWTFFVNKAKERGHYVAFVTARSEGIGNEDIEANAQMLGIPIVYCNGKQKAECFKADIWIDDNPLWIPTLEGMRGALDVMSLGV